MLFGTQPTEIIIREPDPYMAELPYWGRSIVQFVGDRLFLEADQIIHTLFGSGNRTGKRKLYELSKMDFLTRYELYCLDQEKPIIAYSLGTRGMRVTRRLAPVVSINRAQEYIVVNEFLFTHQHTLDKYKLYHEKSLLTAEFTIDNNRLAIWAPREDEHRLKSLITETSLHNALVTITPTRQSMERYAKLLVNLNLNKPLYFAYDNRLEIIWQMVDGVLEQLNED